MLQFMLSFEEFSADLPVKHTQWFTSPSDLEKALAEHGIIQPTRQASRGEFRAGLAARKMQDCELYSDRYSTAISVHLQTPPDELAILLPRSPHDHFIVNGINLENSQLALTPTSGAMDIAGSGPIGSDCIAMSETRFLELLETLCPTAGITEGLSLVKVFAPELRSLGDLIVNLMAETDIKSQCERSGNLLAWTVSLIGHASEQFRPDEVNGNAVRHQIARNTQDFIEANFHECVQLEGLCRHTGVGIRTVQRSFREYFDLSVTDYLKNIRLDKAHRALETTKDGEESVTDIALRSGFTHLGRFSVAYRTRYGESPSETLVSPTGTGDS
jgi:AraC-like DNA-binding protein